jgi:hypothetical protein
MSAAFPDTSETQYLIFDRDAKFGTAVLEFAKASGMDVIRTSYRSPWQNGVAERYWSIPRLTCPDKFASSGLEFVSNIAAVGSEPLDLSRQGIGCWRCIMPGLPTQVGKQSGADL